MIRLFVFWHFALALLLGLSAPVPAAAQGATLFDAGAMSREEIRFLQTALSLADTYGGTIDGAWGAYSRQALEKALRCEDPCRPTAAEVDAFVGSAAARLASEGWQTVAIPAFGASMLVPGEARVPQWIDSMFVSVHSSPGLTIHVARGPLEMVLGIGERLRQNARTDLNSWFPNPKSRLRVWTAYASMDAVFRNGDRSLGVFYLRSDFRNGDWSHVLVAAPASRVHVLRTVVNSLVAGSGEPLVYPVLSDAPAWREANTASAQEQESAAMLLHSTDPATDLRLAEAEVGSYDAYTSVVSSGINDPEPASAATPLANALARVMGDSLQ